VIVTDTPAASATAPAIESDDETGAATTRQRNQAAASSGSAIGAIKIAAGSIGGLCIAIVLLLVLGVDPFGITGSDEPASPSVAGGGGETITPPVPAAENKPPIDSQARSPFRVQREAATENGANTDPFVLSLAENPTVANSPVWPPATELGASDMAQALAISESLSDRVNELVAPDSQLDTAMRRERSKALTGQLARVAEVATFVDAAASGQVDQIVDNIVKINEQSTSRELIGAIGLSSYGDSDLPSQGVVLVGALREVVEQGAVYEMQFEPLGGGQIIPVLSWTDPVRLVEIGAPLVVVGVIVETPKEKIPGYRGGQERVVWAGGVIPLSQTADNTGGE
jgi:hypothetical protein